MNTVLIYLFMVYLLHLQFEYILHGDFYFCIFWSHLGIIKPITV